MTNQVRICAHSGTGEQIIRHLINCNLAEYIYNQYFLTGVEFDQLAKAPGCLGEKSAKFS